MEHQHRWIIRERVIAPPKCKPIAMPFPEEERMIHGTTSWLLSCDCGEMKTLTVLGQPESTARANAPNFIAPSREMR